MEELALARFVRPRVIDHGSEGREPVRIEDALERRLDQHDAGALYVEGPQGSGRGTALEYVRLCFADRPEVSVGAHVQDETEGQEPIVRLLLSLGAAVPPRARLELVPWTRDEWIEYLLGRHREACPRVMARLDAPEAELDLKGRPLLWAAILDELARDPELPSAFLALCAAVRRRFSCARMHAQAAEACWLALSHPPELHTLTHAFRELARNEPEAAPFLAQSSVQVLLAAQCVADALARGGTCHLPRRIATVVLRAARPLLRLQPAARANLASLLDGRQALVTSDSTKNAHGSVASLLHLYGPTALTEVARSIAERNERFPWLTGAELEGLEAPCASLRGIKLDEAHLARAQLDGADLEGARLNRADLRCSSLRGARLVNAVARRADFSGADLRGAGLNGSVLGAAQFNATRLEAACLRQAQLDGAGLRRALLDRADLTGASLRAANLSEASLVDTQLESAILDGVDLRTTRLQTRRLACASLVGSNLEGLQLDRPDLTGANLRDALLSGTVLKGAVLRSVLLTGASLARIQWAGADLRDADLSQASFHRGSSHGGLVLSAPADWGMHTGFYTEEMRDQDYRPPEAIRTADLRRADLRGAKIADADFYLVDLRGAHYTPDQERHLRTCGAILS